MFKEASILEELTVFTEEWKMIDIFKSNYFDTKSIFLIFYLLRYNNNTTKLLMNQWSLSCLSRKFYSISKFLVFFQFYINYYYIYYSNWTPKNNRIESAMKNITFSYIYQDRSENFSLFSMNNCNPFKHRTLYYSNTLYICLYSRTFINTQV